MPLPPSKKQPAQWQPRFTLYSQVHGKTPEAMLAHDKQLWPGGCMCGFMLWIGAAWSHWHQSRGLCRSEHIKTQADHDSFNKMLETFLPLPAE